ncbi:WD repeat-containing protein 82, putative [Plasmodium vinckei petteri]|uniref:WD repeat-containing protein 82, putative n=1 Tax=Plasmodium vinckei petteri TaxID=138298 RepID=A0A6V7THT9_PLAVN|nr:WD repeat-containing protein 82, putative [Plasmodium vinckei petteri]
MNSIVYKKIKLNDDIIKKFEVLRAFKYKHAITRNMAWSYDGELLLTSNKNDSITIYSLVEGRSYKTLQSKNCGVDVVRFLDNANEIIVCSTKSNNSEHKQFLRFWDIKENKYVKSLPQIGNICELNGISVNPNKKLMLVNSDDCHVKLYYFNCDIPLIIYKSNFKRPVSCFDNEGLIFIASYGKKEIHFYDVLMYNRGEYNVVSLKNIIQNDEFITNLLFTPNNKAIIVSTSKNNHFKIDSITGKFICSYKYSDVIPKNKQNLHYNPGTTNNDFIEESTNNNTTFNQSINVQNLYNNSTFQNRPYSLFIPTITPDGKYIMCGWRDNGIHIWKESGEYMTSLYGHAGPPENVSFNPKCAILASSCLNVALWQPSI